MQTAEYFAPRAQPCSSPSASGISEIVLAHQTDFTMLLPALAYLSQQSQQRWLTWLPPEGVSKSLLLQFGFDLKKIRIVRPRNSEACFWLMREALAQGNSETVVASPGPMSETQLKQLEHSARVGACNGLLVRYRQAN